MLKCQTFQKNRFVRQLFLHVLLVLAWPQVFSAIRVRDRKPSSDLSIKLFHRNVATTACCTGSKGADCRTVFQVNAIFQTESKKISQEFLAKDVACSVSGFGKGVLSGRVQGVPTPAGVHVHLYP